MSMNGRKPVNRRERRAHARRQRRRWRIAAGAVVVSPANHLAFVRQITKRDARLQIQQALRRHLGYA